MRSHYVQHFSSIIPANTPILLIALEYDQAEMNGPPFSVTADEVQQLYQPRYHIELLHTHDALAEEPHFRNKGLTQLTEKVYKLIPKSVA